MHTTAVYIWREKQVLCRAGLWQTYLLNLHNSIQQDQQRYMNQNDNYVRDEELFPGLW